MPRAKGSTSKPRNAKERQLISAGFIFNRCVQHAKGEVEMTATQLKAADIVLSKTMPSLANVEQTIMNDSDALSMEQIQAQMIAIVQANPDLLQVLINASQPIQPSTAEQVENLH